MTAKAFSTTATKRQRPWTTTVGFTTAVAVSLLAMMDGPVPAEAWQQPVLPRSMPTTIGSSSSSSTTARRYAVETEIVAATAAATHPPASSSSSRKKASSSPSHHTRRIKTVTQISHAPSVLHPKHGSSSQKEDLLTREEEAMYSYRVRLLRAAIRKRDELTLARSSDDSNNNNNNDDLAEEEWAASCGTTVRQLRKWLIQGREAREVLCSANVGLVATLARKHYHRLRQATQGNTILTMADLVQEGNLGLLTAAERFEPERGYKFSTYAYYWIRQRISLAVSDKSRVIRLPAHIHSTLSKLNRYKAEFQTTQGRDPTPTELASGLEISTTKLAKLAESSRSVMSLQTPMKARVDDTRTLGDTLPSAAPSPEEECHQAMLQADVQHMLETVLTDQERDIVTHLYGLKDGKPRTVAATSEALQIPRDTVRLVEARALHKLRKSPDCRLQDYVADASSRTQIRTKQSMRSKMAKRKIWELPVSDPVVAGAPSAPEEDEKTSIRRLLDVTTTGSSYETSPAERGDKLWFF